MLLHDPQQVKGLRSTRALRPGEVLTEAGVEAIPLVKRSEVVRVQAFCGAFIISTQAIACEDGTSGAVIHVRNVQTRQEFSAKVTGVGAVEAIP